MHEEPVPSGPVHRFMKKWFGPSKNRSLLKRPPIPQLMFFSIRQSQTGF
jgi:hypothetical protein